MSSNNYQPEFADGHQAGPEGPTVAIDEDTITQVIELLDVCDEFLRAAGPGVHAELRTYLAGHTPPIDFGLFIDTLGLTALLMRGRLPVGTPAPNHATGPRDETTGQVTA